MAGYCNRCMSLLEASGEKCGVCGAEKSYNIPAHHLLPGTLLNKKFYVGEALGEGGFGITYIGRDIKLDMKVAIKEFFPNGYVNRSNAVSADVSDSVTEGRRDFFEKGRDRFLKEARILAKFSGEPGVVDVRDFFEENNTAYIVMEYLDGVDLKTYLREKGTLTPEHTVQLLMPVMNSLKKVHAQGLIHRDISPDNIMIVGDKVKLLDFGAARTVSAAANKSLSVMLKPGYAPEEQYRSKGNQGPWTDIYALCATMYKCITGITPDDATQRVYCDEVKTPSALNIAIKPELEKAIMRGMSVHQIDRYQNIEDLIRGLQAVDEREGDPERTIVPGIDFTLDENNTVYLSPEDADKTVYQAPCSTLTEKTADPAVAEPVTEHTETAQTKQEQPEQKPAKKKKKAVIFAVLALALVAVAVVCFLKFINEPESSGNPTNNNNTTPSQPTSTQPTLMSDVLLDFTFKLEGVVYQLPCRFEDLTKNGWTIADRSINSETKVRGEGYAHYEMVKDGKTIYVYSYNMSGNAKAVKDCKIGGVSCYGYGADFSIAKGITTASSAAEVKAAFGTPNDLYVGSDYESITYYAGNNSFTSVKIRCDSDVRYSSIDMKNFIRMEDDATVTNPQRPGYLDQYQKPVQLGNDITSGVVAVEGNLYRLPAPVSSFLDNGWMITQQSGDVVAGATGTITVKKGVKSLTLYIANPTDYQTIVENCLVYKLNVDNDDGVAISLPGIARPITLNMTHPDLLVQLTTGYDSYTTTYYTYYDYEDEENGVNISIKVDMETNLVYAIEISYDL